MPPTPVTRRRKIVVALGGVVAVLVVAGLIWNHSQRAHQVGFAGGAGLPDGAAVAERMIHYDIERGPRPPGAGEEEQVPGEFVVRFRPTKVPGLKASGGALSGAVGTLAGHLQAADLSSARPALRVSPMKDNGPALKLGSSFVVHSDLALQDLRDELEGQPEVESVEPRIRVSALGEPNDSWYHFQWDMQQLDLPNLIETLDGTGITVAVIDSGVTPGGPDSFAHLLQGYDFAQDDTDATDSDAAVFDFSHGTHVAGTIAQHTNNEVGTTGLATGASILPVRVLSYDAEIDSVVGSSDAIAAGIVWAVDHGAQVINMSLGSATRSDLIADACEYAYESGVLVVASSGNDGFTDQVLYPAVLPTVLSVGATGMAHNVTAYSNGGPGLDLVAPGGEYDEDRDGDGHGDGTVQESVNSKGFQYIFSEGTSMAAPHVAAAAALLYQRGWTQPAAVAEVLITTATDIAPEGRDDASGYGELNIEAAVALPVDESALAESGAVTISNVSVDYSSDGRAWVAWDTNVAASTEASGTDVNLSDELATHTHKVLVVGSPGVAETVTVKSTSGDGQADSEPVPVVFPVPADSALAGCQANAAGFALVGPALVAWRRRRSANPA